MLLAGRSKKDLNHLKDLLKKEFDMKDMRESKKFRGVDITRRSDQFTLIIRPAQPSPMIAPKKSYLSWRHSSSFRNFILLFPKIGRF